MKVKPALKYQYTHNLRDSYYVAIANSYVFSSQDKKYVGDLILSKNPMLVSQEHPGTARF